MKKRSPFNYLIALTPIITMMATYCKYHFPGEQTILILLCFFAVFGIRNAVRKDRQSLARWFVFWNIFIYSFIGLLHWSFPPLSIFYVPLYAYVIIILKDDCKKNIIQLFINCLAILFLLSIIEYLFISLGSGHSIGTVYRYGISEYQHYFFNLYNGRPRFQGLMDEPGTVGTFCGFLLFALRGKKQYRKQFVIFLISGLISFSFAFYVLLAFYLMTSFQKKSMGGLFVLGIVAYLIYMLMPEYLDQFVLERYASGSYDNRINDTFEPVFNSFVNSNDLWLGTGFEAVKKYVGINSVKKDLYIFGVFGIVCIVLNYIITYFKVNRYSLSSIVFITVFWLSYYQRTDIGAPHNVILLFSLYILQQTSEKAKLSTT